MSILYFRRSTSKKYYKIKREENFPPSFQAFLAQYRTQRPGFSAANRLAISQHRGPSACSRRVVPLNTSTPRASSTMIVELVRMRTSIGGRPFCRLRPFRWYNNIIDMGKCQDFNLDAIRLNQTFQKKGELSSPSPPNSGRSGRPSRQRRPSPPPAWRSGAAASSRGKRQSRGTRQGRWWNWYAQKPPMERAPLPSPPSSLIVYIVSRGKRKVNVRFRRDTSKYYKE